MANPRITMKPVSELRPRAGGRKRTADLRRGLLKQIIWRSIGSLKPFPDNPRRHPESQIAALMKSIKRVWTIPILIDGTAMILAGHGRLEAAKRLGMSEVPTVTIAGLSKSEKRAIVVADNRLPERAEWNFELLKKHFEGLIDLNFDVELTGFSTGEIDLILDGNSSQESTDPADDVSGFAIDGPAISKLGDDWDLGRHRLHCGSALDRDSYKRLMRGDVAQMMVTDPPFINPSISMCTFMRRI
jgi:ParB-like chromosome segregation protein Spo0J